jgi:hypothetical protein
VRWKEGHHEGSHTPKHSCTSTLSLSGTRSHQHQQPQPEDQSTQAGIPIIVFHAHTYPRCRQSRWRRWKSWCALGYIWPSSVWPACHYPGCHPNGCAFWRWSPRAPAASFDVGPALRKVSYTHGSGDLMLLGVWVRAQCSREYLCPTIHRQVTESHAHRTCTHHHPRQQSDGQRTGDGNHGH